jgi:hypothetical protein
VCGVLLPGLLLLLKVMFWLDRPFRSSACGKFEMHEAKLFQRFRGIAGHSDMLNTVWRRI